MPSKQKKIITVIGARPQFIKASAVSRQMLKSGLLEEILVHTGQHYDENMSQIFFDQMDIPKPKYNLGIGGGLHGQNTGRMLEKLEELLIEESPKAVMVYGDTDSTLAGALAAAKLHIPVVHVEAGLRSFNKEMPEEINRILTDHVSDFLLTPTEVGRSNLIKEGVLADKITPVGDVMFDAALFYRDLARPPVWVGDLNMEPVGFALCTIHRAENTDNVSRLHSIIDGLGRSGWPVILPLHPRTKRKIQDAGITLPGNVMVRDPVGYLEMVWLEMNSMLVVTDSGGVQKEAYFHGKPCVTLRDQTEWTELVASGWNVLVGADAKLIGKAMSDTKVPTERPNFYGAGDASQKIVDVLRAL